nr:MAG: internal scaffolding protein [Microvirus sp.]
MAKSGNSEMMFPTFANVANDFVKSSGMRGDMSSFEPSLTRQEFVEECDINTLMARYEAGGAISHVNKAEPLYLDTTLYPGLQGAMDAFKEASIAFGKLPAAVRREFDNDPQKFVDFAIVPGNVGRMREWGLAEPVAVPDGPVKVEVVSAPPIAPLLEGASKPA